MRSSEFVWFVEFHYCMQHHRLLDGRINPVSSTAWQRQNPSDLQTTLTLKLAPNIPNPLPLMTASLHLQPKFENGRTLEMRTNTWGSWLLAQTARANLRKALSSNNMSRPRFFHLAIPENSTTAQPRAQCGHWNWGGTVSSSMALWLWVIWGTATDQLCPIKIFYHTE